MSRNTSVKKAGQLTPGDAFIDGGQRHVVLSADRQLAAVGGDIVDIFTEDGCWARLRVNDDVLIPA